MWDIWSDEVVYTPYQQYIASFNFFQTHSISFITIFIVKSNSKNPLLLQKIKKKITFFYCWPVFSKCKYQPLWQRQIQNLRNNNDKIFFSKSKTSHMSWKQLLSLVCGFCSIYHFKIQIKFLSINKKLNNMKQKLYCLNSNNLKGIAITYVLHSWNFLIIMSWPAINNSHKKLSTLLVVSPFAPNLYYCLVLTTISVSGSLVCTIAFPSFVAKSKIIPLPSIDTELRNRQSSALFHALPNQEYPLVLFKARNQLAFLLTIWSAVPACPYNKPLSQSTGWLYQFKGDKVLENTASIDPHHREKTIVGHLVQHKKPQACHKYGIVESARNNVGLAWKTQIICLQKRKAY